MDSIFWQEFENLIKDQNNLIKPDMTEKEFQEFRKGKLTSSDIIPSLLRLGYDSPQEAWRLYNGKEKVIDKYLQDLFDFGKKNEAVIFEMFYKRVIKEGFKFKMFSSGCFTRKFNDLAIYSTPDGHFWDGEILHCVEIKSRNPQYAHIPIENVTQIKDPHMVQMMCQMYCTGLKSTYYVVGSGKRLDIFKMVYSDKIMTEILEELENYLKEARICGNEWPSRTPRIRIEWSNSMRSKLRDLIKKIN